MITDQLSIDTPENVIFNFEIAGIGTRFLALLIDSIIQGLVVLVFVLAGTFARGAIEGVLAGLPNWFVAVLAVGIFLVYSLYFIIFELVLSGQTPGKRVVGLRVILENGYPLGIAAILIRNLVRLIDFFPFAYSLGFIVMLFNARSKRLGDLAAGTLVVKERKMNTANDLGTALRKLEVMPVEAALSPTDDMTGDNAITQLARKLSEQEVQMIESLLQRRHELVNASSLAQKVADAIAGRLQSPELEESVSHLNDYDFLQRLAQAYRNRQKSIL